MRATLSVLGAPVGTAGDALKPGRPQSDVCRFGGELSGTLASCTTRAKRQEVALPKGLQSEGNGKTRSDVAKISSMAVMVLASVCRF
jgi:hypothetical protein